MQWIYDPQLKYVQPDVYRRMFDGRILFAETDRDEGVIYYNYVEADPPHGPN